MTTLTSITNSIEAQAGFNLSDVKTIIRSDTINKSSSKPVRVTSRSSRGNVGPMDEEPILSKRNIDRLVKDMYDMIKSRRIPPVTSRDVYPHSKHELWDNLKPIPLMNAGPEHEFLVLGTTPRTNYYLRPRLVPQGDDKKLDSRYLILVSEVDSYAVVDRLTDYYQEERRLDAYHSDINIERFTGSANQMWETQPHILKKWLRSAIIRYTNKSGSDTIDFINYEDRDFLAELLQSLFDDRVHVSQYRITWVVSIIEFFRQFIKIDSMLDPSMGWGDRLLGAMKVGVSYRGYDPNKSLHTGYKRMINDFSKEANSSDREYIHIPIGFEDAVIEERVDFILTSPPYGDIEVYTTDPDQSIIKFQDNWMTGFYEPYLIKAWSALRPGGILVLQIGDNRNFKMVDHTIKFFKSIEDSIHWGQFLTYAQVGRYGNLHIVYRKMGRGSGDSL